MLGLPTCLEAAALSKEDELFLRHTLNFVPIEEDLGLMLNPDLLVVTKTLQDRMRGDWYTFARRDRGRTRHQVQRGKVVSNADIKYHDSTVGIVTRGLTSYNPLDSRKLKAGKIAFLSSKLDLCGIWVRVKHIQGEPSYDAMIWNNNFGENRYRWYRDETVFDDIDQRLEGRTIRRVIPVIPVIQRPQPRPALAQLPQEETVWKVLPKDEVTNFHYGVKLPRQTQSSQHACHGMGSIRDWCWRPDCDECVRWKGRLAAGRLEDIFRTSRTG